MLVGIQLRINCLLVCVRTHALISALQARKAEHSGKLPGTVDFLYVDEVQDLITVDTKRESSATTLGGLEPKRFHSA